MPKLTLVEMQDLAVKVLVASRTSPENAASVAPALVAADADGLASHGLSRLPMFADQALSGKVDGFAVPEITRPGPAAVRVDACSGFGFPAIAGGLHEGHEVVKETGTVAVAIGNSHQSGVAGYHVERMAEKGLVALSFNNSPAGLGPWGGNRALYGTNPIAFACPRRQAPPLVIDLSLSKVARGKIKLAADGGEAIPLGWAVDEDGQPTTDAAAAMAGTLLPMGDAKGAALALAVEIIAAALTGSNFGFEASSFFTAEGPPPHVGQFFLLMDPAVFAGDGFVDRVEVLLGAILDQPGTRLPGQKRLASREKAKAQGVEVPPALYEDLVRRAGAEPD